MGLAHLQSSVPMPRTWKKRRPGKKRGRGGLPAQIDSQQAVIQQQAETSHLQARMLQLGAVILNIYGFTCFGCRCYASPYNKTITVSTIMQTKMDQVRSQGYTQVNALACHIIVTNGKVGDVGGIEEALLWMIIF